ncbi:DEAD/DEAH box helicase family protein [Methanoplanus limicola]|uniref:DEAD-like helicase n=1 Tax=Methanoplanus limicola DSM 2279 TaxID=937775 RepID=H1YYM0_9EURY|nr:DEAD/DEAH box helicase [Methanoplanus limicola]EHQ36003.1 DEAD-like helicase [Methanoplanus limicola DSM 2279]
MILGDRGKIAPHFQKPDNGENSENYDLYIKHTSKFLNIYEKYLLKAREYQKKNPSYLFCEAEHEKTGDGGAEKKENTNCWVTLKSGKNLSAANFQKIKSGFFDSDRVIDPGREKYANTSFSKYISILDIDYKEDRLLLSQRPSSEKIILPPQLYVIEKQIEAIRALANNCRDEYLPIIKLFQPKSGIETVLDEFPIEYNPVTDWEILDSDAFACNDKYGTQIQKKFVNSALNSPDFCILNGPPGSGKTESICELILQAAKRGKKILLCAPTHTAVDNVLAKIADREEITAVRISAREIKVDERLKDYHIDKRRDTERKRIIDYIETEYPDQISESQEYFLSAVKTNNDIATEIILNSANLICGTTMGILHHPSIKNMKENIEPAYDLLIIDEASRATFQEWLVPALFAKKWVIVGDPLQLPPFVNEKELGANIKASIIEEIKKSEPSPDYETIEKVCTDISICSRYKAPVLISEEDPKVRDYYRHQAESTGIQIIDLDNNHNNIRSSKPVVYLSCNCKTDAISKRILSEIIYASGKDIDETITKKAENNFKKKFKNREYSFEKNLEVALAWRTERKFELRYFKKGDGNSYGTKKRYSREIRNLLPEFEPGFKNILLDEIRNIEFIPLPSIIELITSGYHGDKSPGNNCITGGLTEKDLEKRYYVLEFQHRSHDDIIKYSRENIYNRQGLECLKSTKTISDIRERELNLIKYNNRAVWVTYPYTPISSAGEKKNNVNETEAEILISHLTDIITELKESPGLIQDKPWNIAVLTFYQNQKELLVRLFKNKFNVSGNSVFFPDDERITVTINTVDGFQGHEADIVLLSIVNTDRIGFLDSLNRLNVALTRARHYMILFGFRKYFKSQEDSSILKDVATGPYYMKFPEKKK